MAKFECPGCGNVIYIQMVKKDHEYICHVCDTTLEKQGKK